MIKTTVIANETTLKFSFVKLTKMINDISLRWFGSNPLVFAQTLLHFYVDLETIHSTSTKVEEIKYLQDIRRPQFVKVIVKL